MAEQQNAKQQNAKEPDLNQLLKVRREKLAELQAAGKDPFQITKYDVTVHSEDVKVNYAEYEGKEVSIAGRMMSKRVMGKASFCNVQDLKGNIQCYVARDDTHSRPMPDDAPVTMAIFFFPVLILHSPELPVCFVSKLRQSCAAILLIFSYERCGSSFSLPVSELLFFRLLQACPHSGKLLCWLRQTYCCHFQPLFRPYARQHASGRRQIHFHRKACPPVGKHFLHKLLLRPSASPSDGSGIFYRTRSDPCARP